MVEYSRQTQCGDTPKNPTIVCWALFCHRGRSLEPRTPMHVPFYIPLILMLHATTYITDMSSPHHCVCSNDVMLIFGGNPCACIQLCECKILTQSISASLTMINLLLWGQIFWPQVHPMTLSPRYLSTSSHQVCQGNNLLKIISLTVISIVQR